MQGGPERGGGPTLRFIKLFPNCPSSAGGCSWRLARSVVVRMVFQHAGGFWRLRFAGSAFFLALDRFAWPFRALPFHLVVRVSSTVHTTYRQNTNSVLARACFHLAAADDLAELIARPYISRSKVDARWS